MYIIKTIPHAVVVLVSEMERVRATNEGDLLYVNNSCVNTVRAHFPWRILDVLMKETREPVLLKRNSAQINCEDSQFSL